ncbi:unnamed protein product [Psylliodes chrysocephalus]|uniref:Myb/SANT-like DNA-binding domain-containing protein n=1 Tax=Psylliodes chrysocephalus TaxID=3402493 RepID=A0A9P0CV01_9CUCU|nr:unnamed protein product [Psylliodes chrysocephala]
MLISCVKQYKEDLESCQKKRIWEKISKEINEKLITNFTPTQVDTKWKGLVRLYKDIKKHNDTSGKNKKSWKYWLLMNEILFNKPEIVAPATCSSNKGLIVNVPVENIQGEQHGTSFQNKRKAKSNSIEKRHHDKMLRIDNLNSSIQELISVIRERKSTE